MMFRRFFKTEQPGFYRGKHYTKYVERVTELKRQNKLKEAEALLLALIAAVEAEETVQQHSRAPWYTEQLAIIYRDQHRYADEVAILERYDSRAGVSSFADRIATAKALLANGS
jgi:hypothetical protein